MATYESYDYFKEKIQQGITPKDIAIMVLMNKKYECLSYIKNRWSVKEHNGTLFQVNIQSIFLYVNEMINLFVENIDNNDGILNHKIDEILKKINMHNFQQKILYFLNAASAAKRPGLHPGPT